MRYLRKLRGLTQDEFASKLSIKRSLLGAYEEERADPKIEVLEVVCKLFKLTMDELLLKDLSVQSKSSYLDFRRRIKLANDVNLANIHFVPIKASAGYLSGYSDPEFIAELNSFTLPMVTPGNYRAFEIIGDSMLPTPSGSVVIAEKVETIDNIENTHAYVLLSKSDGVVYKRIMRNNRNKTRLTLMSDNPNYTPYQMSLEDILEVWQAKYILQKAEPVQKWDVGQIAHMVTDLTVKLNSIEKNMKK
ncbi:MAG: helix-turn-helix domain-containing protein [Phycisphaerales bacterium]|nr:helix-turn-helix domain-containing protein [Phycisphaerales bacterium]